MAGLSQRIELVGAEVIEQALAKIGATGKLAFDAIQAAAAKATPAIAAMETTAKSVGNSFGAIAVKAQLASTQFTAAAKSATASGQQIQQSVQGAVTPFQAFGAIVGRLASNFKLPDKAATEFGHTLRALGRATHEPELSHLGHTIALLGRYFAYAAPLLLVIGLEKLAASAVKAALAVDDMARKLEISIEDVGKLQNVASGLGITFDKMGKSAESLKKLGEEAVKARDAISEAQGEVSLASMNAGNTSISGNSLGRSPADLQKSYDVLEKAQEKLRALEMQEGNVLQKLGVSFDVDRTGKIRPTVEEFQKLADALHNVGDADRQEDLANDLVAAGIDARLIPALKGGSDALKAYAAEGERIRPAFTEEQVESARKFAAAEQQVFDALASIRDAMGIAVAPAFVAFFESLRETLISLRPQLQELSATYGPALLTLLLNVGRAISSVVVPAFKLFQVGLQLIASALNEVFGTNIGKLQVFIGLIIALGIAFGGIPTMVFLILTVLGLLWNAAKENLGKIVDAFKSGWGAALGFVKQFVDDTLNYFRSWYDSIINWLGDLIEKIKAFLGLQSQVGGGDTGSSAAAAPGLAGGGSIRGAGTGTSDSILIRASNGEYMMRSRAVSHYGVGFMSAINNLRAFALGGLVGVPSFASGGSIRSSPAPVGLHPVTLQFPWGDEVAGLFAPTDVVSSLSHLATSSRVRRAGRKPGWFGA